MLPREAKVGTPSHNGFADSAVFTKWSKGPERQRGSWSFLTWSFFLAQMVAAEQFFGSSARAAQNDDASTTRPNGQSEIPLEEAAAGARWGFGVENGESGAIEQQTQLNGAHGAFFPGLSQAGDLFNPGVLPSLTTADGGSSSGGGPSTGSQPLSSHADSKPLGDSPTPPNEVILPPAGEPGAPDGIVTIPDIGIGPDLGPDLDLGLDLDPIAEVSLGVDLNHGGVEISIGPDVNLDLDLGPTLAASLGLSTELTFGVNLSNADASLALGLEAGGTSPLLSAVDQVTGLVQDTLSGVISNATGVISTDENGTTSSPVLEPFVQLTALATGQDGNDLSSLEDALSSSLSAILNGPAMQAPNQSTQGLIPISDGPVASIVSNTTGLVSLQGGEVSSGDAITFSGGATSKMADDDLFTGGRYTDYSLALQTDDSLGAGGLTDQLGDTSDKGTSWLNDGSGVVNEASAESRSAADEAVDTSHLGLPSTVEELGRADAV